MEICGLPGLLHLYPLSCLSLREWRDDWPEFQTTALFTFRITALMYVSSFGKRVK